MQALRAKVRLGEPSVQRFAARGGKLVEELAAVTPATQRADQPVALEALERRVNLADIDFPGTAEQRFKTVFHLVSVERLLGEEAQHPVPKRHYPYSVCIKSMHRSQRQCQDLFFRLARVYLWPARYPSYQTWNANSVQSCLRLSRRPAR